MKILVIGAGIGGLTTAACLKKKGHTVDIIEKRSKHADGYILLMMPNGMRVLDYLGLGGSIRRAGTTFSSKRTYDENDNLNTTSFKPYIREQKPLIIKRATLIQSLLQGQNVHWNTTCTHIVQGSDVTVTFSTGLKNAYDLVVAADGVHSTIRDQFHFKTKTVGTKRNGWWFWIPKLFSFKDDILVFTSKKAFMGIYPCSGKICVYTNLPTRYSTISALKNMFIRNRLFSFVAKHIPPRSQMFVGEEETTYVSKLYSGSVVLLGDAAHGLPQFNTLGASLAMEGAYVLSRELSKRNTSLALQRYNTIMKRRSLYIQNLNAKNRQRALFTFANKKLPN